MRLDEFHAKRTLKRINWLENQNSIAGRRDVIIRGDSKARYLMAHVHEDPYMNINHRGGATIYNTFLGDYTLNRIKRSYKPIVIIWLGTCELTEKRGKFIRIVENIDERLDEIETQYTLYKERILSANAESTVIYLECPFFNIPLWNKHKGHYNPDGFEPDQILLEKAIKRLNIILRSITDDEVRNPKLSLDLEESTKKRNKPRKYHLNYKALSIDGVHPGKDIARLWYLRIVRMISFL